MYGNTDKSSCDIVTPSCESTFLRKNCLAFFFFKKNEINPTDYATKTKYSTSVVPSVSKTEKGFEFDLFNSIFLVFHTTQLRRHSAQHKKNKESK